eukprot:497659_1
MAQNPWSHAHDEYANKSVLSTANSMKAKHVAQTSLRTALTKIKAKVRQNVTLKDMIPLTLANLSQYFDWKHTVSQAPTLHKIASVIWSYLPNAEPEEYSVNFQHAADHVTLETAPKAPP